MDPNSAASIKALNDLTVVVTKLATTSDLQGKQMSADITEIKADIKEIKSDSLTRSEFSTFHLSEFKPLQDAQTLSVQIFASKRDVDRLYGFLWKSVGFILAAIAVSVLSLIFVHK